MPQPSRQNIFRRFFSVLRPGLITGAADDDPSGVATYTNRVSHIPFALIGGILALVIGQFNLSVSASVGFIALFGVAVLNGVVMVSYFMSYVARD